ncbi:DUF7224 domain-containing protein [Streptomyces zingiberis]|uniref:DUF7224 domain-containing protein n=1 Tax=Streptomyces zingiberis TaxID=2053010 RepID=A0ABX1BN44_9ACTN|nr:hypothetical protein [Streptomyces zingiberis]NJP99158.1 hypothetical protein [Streptomyces zingiberis]
MGLRNALRRSSLLWAGPVLLGLALYYTSLLWERPGTGFGGDAGTEAALAMGPVPAGLAAVAAWEAGRLRAGKAWALTPSRHRYRIAVEALRPVLLLMLLVDLVVFAGASLHVGAAPRLAEDLPLIGTLLTVQVAALVIGFGAGCALPRPPAAPLVGLALVLWSAVPATLETPWVRHLTGLVREGPTVTDSIAPHALLAPVVLWSAAVAAVLVAAVRLRGRLLRAVLAVLCLAAGAVPAQAMVADDGYLTATVPRTGHQACDDRAPRICVPEEYADMLPRLRSAARTVVPELVAAGYDRPRALVHMSRSAPASPDTWRIRVERPLTENRALSAVATALVPVRRWDDCPRLPDDYAGRPSPGPLTAWMRLTAGMDERVVAAAHSEATLRRVAGIRALTPAAQKRWADGQARALRSCDPRVHAEARR